MGKPLTKYFKAKEGWQRLISVQTLLRFLSEVFVYFLAANFVPVQPCHQKYSFTMITLKTSFFPVFRDPKGLEELRRN